MTEIYVVRHGESESNAKATFTGQLNPPLSNTGLKQADCVTSFFDGIHIDAIYSSDLQRACRTVEGVAKRKKLFINTTEKLREINAGSWHGIAFKDIKRIYGAAFDMWKSEPWNFVFPEGESTLELGNRVYNEIQNIAEKHKNETVLISTHSTPMRVFISKVRTGGFEAMGDVALKNGSITKLTYQDGAFSIKDFGITDHLGELITGLPQCF